MTEPTRVARRLTSISLLALVLLLASACGDNDKKTSSSAQRTSTTPNRTSTTPSGTRQTPTSPLPTPTTKKRVKGFVLQSLTGSRAQSQNLYPLLSGDLSRYVGGQVEGIGIKVVKLAAADAFWAGKALDKRLLIHINLKGRPAPKLRAGQTVDIIGLLKRNPATGTLGVKDGPSKALLKKQGAYAEVSIGDVKLR